SELCPTRTRERARSSISSVNDGPRLLQGYFRPHSRLTKASNASRRRHVRKGCALLLFVPVASDAARLLRHRGVRQKAAMCAVENEGDEFFAAPARSSTSCRYCPRVPPSGFIALATLPDIRRV